MKCFLKVLYMNVNSLFIFFALFAGLLVTCL